MCPHYISDTFSMDGHFPLSSFATPYYTPGVSNVPPKRRRVVPAPHQSATGVEKSQSAADAASWLLTSQSPAAATPSWFSGSPESSIYPFSNHASTSTQGSSQVSMTTAGSFDDFLPHYMQDASEPPRVSGPKRKRPDSAPYDSFDATWLPGAAIPYQFSDYAFNRSMDEAFVTSETAAVSAPLQASTPHSDASEPPSKRTRVSNAPSKRGRVPNAPSKRGLRAPKRRHVSSAPPNNSVLPGPSIPGDDLFRCPADFLPPSITPPTAAGSPFVEGSPSTPIPNALLGEAALWRPSPGGFCATYPRYTPDDFINSLFVQDDDLPPLFPEASALDFLELAGDEDAWGTAYDTQSRVSASASGSSQGLTSNTQAHVSADGPAASGSSHGLPSSSLPPPTAQTPSRHQSDPLEDVPSRRRPPGVATHSNPHPLSSPLPSGTPSPLELAYQRSQDPTDKHVQCLYRDPFNAQRPCSRGLANFRNWKRHYVRHVVAESSYLKHHPGAAERAVALRYSEFAKDVEPWVCELCGSRGRSSVRDEPLKRHQETQMCERRAEKRRRREGEDGAGVGVRRYEFVP